MTKEPLGCHLMYSVRTVRVLNVLYLKHHNIMNHRTLYTVRKFYIKLYAVRIR